MPDNDYYMYWDNRVDGCFDYKAVKGIQCVPDHYKSAHRFSKLSRKPTPEDIERITRSGGTFAWA